MKRELILVVFVFLLMVYIVIEVGAYNVNEDFNESRGYVAIYLKDADKFHSYTSNQLFLEQNISFFYQYDTGLYKSQHDGSFTLNIPIKVLSLCHNKSLYIDGFTAGFDNTYFSLHTEKQSYWGSFFGTYMLFTYSPISFYNRSGVEIFGHMILKGVDGEILNLDLDTYITIVNYTCQSYKGKIEYFSLRGYTDKNIEGKILSLESFQQTINNTINNLLTSNNDTIVKNNEQDIKLNNQESRITALENKTCSCPSQNLSFPNYLKYLKSTDRKNIVCGYAIENHLTTINDLGFNCNITYTPTRTGERSYCKCVGK